MYRFLQACNPWEVKRSSYKARIGSSGILSQKTVKRGLFPAVSTMRHRVQYWDRMLSVNIYVDFHQTSFYTSCSKNSISGFYWCWWISHHLHQLSSDRQDRWTYTNLGLFHTPFLRGRYKSFQKRVYSSARNFLLQILFVRYSDIISKRRELIPHILVNKKDYVSWCKIGIYSK